MESIKIHIYQPEAKIPIIISLTGWAILLGYLYYSFLQYEQDFIAMMFRPSDYFDTLSRVLVFTSPLMTTVIGYAVNQRIVLKQKMGEVEARYRVLAEKDLRELIDSLIVAFANALDAKSPWTKGHSVRVAEYAVSIAENLGLTRDQVESIKIGALLHDIGKLGTYDSILDKIEPLTNDEYELIKQHPVKGVEILAPIKHLRHVLPIIRHHHERLDGKGYPDGLQDKEIPFISKIVCLADAFDAMISERPYKSVLTKDKALQECRRMAGSQFDSKVVDSFINIINNT